MFSGDDICLNRKHTSRLYEDLDQKITEGFEKVFAEWERNDLRVVRYRETEISDERAHDLVVRAVDAEALPPSSIPRVLKSIESLGILNSCHERLGLCIIHSLRS